MSRIIENFYPITPLAMACGVNIGAKEWTPFRNQIFEEVLTTLEGRHSAAVYLWLYDSAYHQATGSAAVTMAEIARALKVDPRTVKNCLVELSQQDLIRLRRKGIKRSKRQKPVWGVPMASFNIAEGSWTPVPRILIARYLPASTDAVLLPLLLYYQNMRRMDFCWTGVKTLSKRLNWSPTTVRVALRNMFDAGKWNDRHPGLPRPLQCKVINENGKPRRRFSVRAIFYVRTGKNPIMQVSPIFRRAFELL
jgi:hypothetical protein